MSKLLSKNFLYPILLGVSAWIAGTSVASANPSVSDVPAKTPHPTATQPVADSAPQQVTSTEPNAEQIDRATAATEIKPGDWAYQTLQGLTAKYGCGSTLPTGDRTLSREEFATSLNGCVQSMEQLVARRKPRKFLKKRRVAPAPEVVTPAPTPELAPPPLPEAAPVAPPVPAPPEVSQQDLDQLKQLVQSFSTELQGVDMRIKALDGKIADLKDKSFSTTTKLVGEAIFAVTGLAGGPTAATRTTIFSDRVRLNFRSSFTGKDLLLVRLQSRNSNSFASINNPNFNANNPISSTNAVTSSPSRTNMTRLGFEGSEENGTTVHRLQYQLPLASTTKVFVEAVGSELNDNYNNFNPEHQAAGTGSFTRFGRFSSIYRMNNEGAGFGVDHKFSPNLGLVVSYAVPRVATAGITSGTAPETVNSPTAGNGLFDGSNVLFSQVTLKPSDDVSFGLAYARSYHSTGTYISGNNGSGFANNPFGANTNVANTTVLRPTTANHYAVLGSFNLSKNLIFSAWGGLTQARREDAAGSADIWEYAGTLAAKDFGSKGSTLGFVVGMQPKVTSNTVTARVDPATGLHIEAFYKYKVNDNLYVTPGILMLTNPEHNASNPTEYLGTLRTTFNF
jgi:hypothetical protein